MWIRDTTSWASEPLALRYRHQPLPAKGFLLSFVSVLNLPQYGIVIHVSKCVVLSKMKMDSRLRGNDAY